MATRIGWGSRSIGVPARAVMVPLYALGAGLVLVDQLEHMAYYGRLGIALILLGGVVHVLDKMDRNNVTVHEKIDQSVGRVWDAGGRAERRRAEIAAAQPRELAVVRDLAPRR